MRYLLQICFVLLTLIFSCTQNNNNNTKVAVNKHHQHEPDQSNHHQSNHHHSDHNKSNHMMNKQSFKSLTEAFEDNNRIQWQKPDKVIAKLGNIKGLKIGDIGAGTGYFSFRMAELGAQVIAIDVDQRFIDYMNDRKTKNNISNIHTRLVGYDNPGLAEKEFDKLIIVDTYHHFNDKTAYLKHCYLGLKKGGILMNVDFKYKDTEHGPPLDHRISAESVVSDLKNAGFKTIVIDQTTLPEQYIITAKK